MTPIELLRADIAAMEQRIQLDQIILNDKKVKLLKLENPGTSQVCPDCGSTHLIKIATQNQKLCTCGAVIPWTLDKGQESLL